LIYVAEIFIIIQTFTQNELALWKNLFNGENLDGCKMAGSKGVSYVQDGQIVYYRIYDTPEHTFVTTMKKYGDL